MNQESRGERNNGLSNIGQSRRWQECGLMGCETDISEETSGASVGRHGLSLKRLSIGGANGM